MIYILQIILGGVLFRLRGMDLKLSTTINRLIWAVPVGVILFLRNQPNWEWYYQGLYGLGLILSLWLGLIITGWGKWFDLGTQEGDPMEDFVSLSMRGLLNTLFAGILIIPFSFLSGFLFVFSGAFMGVCYWLGYKVPTIDKRFLNQGTEIGEVIYGSLVLALVI